MATELEEGGRRPLLPVWLSQRVLDLFKKNCIVNSVSKRFIMYDASDLWISAMTPPEKRERDPARIQNV